MDQDRHDELASRRAAQNEIIIAALAVGSTYAEAGAQAGVDERTIARRMQEPEFARAVDDRRREHAVEVAGRLSSLGPRAISTIEDLLDDPSPRIRLAAAKLLLELGLKVRTLNEIERDLAEIRQLLAGGP